MFRGRNILYLKDVLVISVTAFGGPQVHLAMMLNLMVRKRKYLTEEELMETIALCSMLPGPTSTQTLTAISLKRGGTPLAILALLIWILPATILMTVLTLGFTVFEHRGFSFDFLQFVQPLAIGIIGYAGYRFGTTVIKNYVGIAIMLLALICSISFTSPWTFPVALVLGGIITNITNRAILPPLKDKPKIDWLKSSFSLALLLSLFLSAAIFGAFFNSKPLVLLENFLRFGTLTYGGGQVLVPMLFEQYVVHNNYLTAKEFISGYALNQAVPGPAFAFATFTGGMALKDWGFYFQRIRLPYCNGWYFPTQHFACVFHLSFLAIPKELPFINRSLEGVSAAATGLVLGAAVVLYANLQFLWINIAVVVVAFLLLMLTKIQPPLLVALGLLAGFIYSKFAG